MGEDFLQAMNNYAFSADDMVFTTLERKKSISYEWVGLGVGSR